MRKFISGFQNVTTFLLVGAFLVFSSVPVVFAQEEAAEDPTICEDSFAVNTGEAGACVYEFGCDDSQAINYGEPDTCQYEPGFFERFFEILVDFFTGDEEADSEGLEEVINGVEEITIQAEDSLLDLDASEDLLGFDSDPVFYECPTFPLHGAYELCNTETIDSSLPLVFSEFCDVTLNDTCYYVCKNGSTDIDCGICFDPEAQNYNELGTCNYDEDAEVIETEEDPEVSEEAVDEISPEFLDQNFFGNSYEGVRLKREAERGVPAYSDAIADSDNNRTLAAGEILLQIFATDTQEDEEGDITTGEIDWVASNILIQRFVNGSPEEFSCQGQTQTEIPVSIKSLETDDLSISSIGTMEFNGSFGDCLVLAGEYFFTIQLVDTASNHTTKVFENVIVPDVVSEIHSDVTASCDQDDDLDGIQYPKANNSDFCTLELALRDQYLNPIDGAGITVELEESSSNRADANQGISFDDGISKRQLQSNIFEVSALAPSIRSYGTDLACLDNRTMEVAITAPTVDGYGEPFAVQTTFEKEIDLRFEPMYLAQPVTTDQVILPGDFTINISSVFHEGAESVDPIVTLYTSTSEEIHDYELDDINLPGYTTDQLTEDIETALRRIPDSDHPLHLITKTSFNLNGETVSYPAGYVGPDPSFIPTLGIDGDTCGDIVGQSEPLPVMLVGATVEGGVTSNNDTLLFDDMGDERLLVLNPFSETMGGNQMRSELRESLWDYLRSDPEFCPDGRFVIEDTEDFQGLWAGGDVVFFRDCEVEIGAETSLGLLPKIRPPQGQKTLIIRNGNLKVNADMVYDQIQDSLGVVLINDDIRSYPVNGNIAVHPKVREFVGTYYADGALFGYDGSNEAINESGFLNADIIHQQERQDNLNQRQLVLSGNIISNNTMGGYMIAAKELYDDSYFFSAWEKEANEIDSLDYDLHYMRRFDAEGNTDLCRRTETGECDENEMSFVIRNDLRVINFPPPGF